MSELSAFANTQAPREIDLSDSIERRRLAALMLSDIDKYCVETYDDGHRNHLGASMIGRKCHRQLWSTFRWLRREVTTGRQQRLFNRGHREEARFIEWLRGIGCTVSEYAPEVLHYHPESDSYFIEPEFNAGDGLVVDVTDDERHVGAAALRGVELKKKQLRISGVMGHYGGSMDGRLVLPARYHVSEPMFTAEFKTSGTGAKFNNLGTNGVEAEKPEHFAQMSTYGWKQGFRYAVYMCINKNDDSLYIEIVKLNWKLAEDLERKAGDIITSQVPPPKISQSPTTFDCKFCHFSPICHSGEMPEKNCRSCVHGTPIEDAQWGCARVRQIIPADFIPVGCDDWEPIA